MGKRGDLGVIHYTTAIRLEIAAGLPLVLPAGARIAPANTHAIVLFGPSRVFSNVAPALALAYHTVMDSWMTWRTKSIPSLWGSEDSM